LYFVGQFGRVYKADFVKDTGSVPVAVKSIKVYTESQKRNFLREQAVMAEMVHPNVVRLYGLIERGMLCNHGQQSNSRIPLLNIELHV
jgi:serine/threonine protein kinase